MTTKTTTTKTTKTTKKQSDSNDKAVRAYLEFLSDPLSVLDEKAIKAAQKELDIETDPLNKLRLNGTLNGLKDVNTAGDFLKEAFVDIAKQWASDNGVTAKDFSETYSVPRSVLSEANLLIGRIGVGKSVVEAAIRDAGEIFTIPSITNQTGSAYRTVSTTVQGLVKDGTLEIVEPPNEVFIGRPSIYYRVVSS
jgi:hypothetical protein